MAEKNKELPLDINGDVDWQKYYEEITPSIPEGELEELKGKTKKSPFTPEDEFSESVPLKVDPETAKWYKKQRELEAEYQGLNPEDVPIDELDYNDFLEEESYEPGEDVDPDFQEEPEQEEDSEEQLKEKSLYMNGLPNDADLFLIVIEEENQIEDKVIRVHLINEDEKEIIFKDEDKNDIKLLLDDELNIILDSNDYKYNIIDFEKIEEFDIKDLDDEDIFLTKDIYQEIELDVEEVKEKRYTIQEKKESLITELISLFKAYNNKSLILNICEIADTYEKMLKENESKDFDYSDLLPFLKNVSKDEYKLPPWIIPIVDNIKKLYKDEEDVAEDYDDVSYTDFQEELDRKEDVFFSQENTYQKYSRSFTGFSPFYNKESGIIIPHDGHYIRDCNDVNPCHGINGDYIFELNKTRKPFIIPLIKDSVPYYETIIPKEKLSITGLYALSRIDYDLTYQDTDLLSLYEKSILCEKKYSYIPFNKRLNYSEIAPHIMGPRTIKEDFYKRINLYTFDPFVNQENLDFTLKKNLPNISDIIEHIPKNVLSKIYNYDDVKKILLPYGLTYHIMDNENKEKINEMIKKNTNAFIKDYNKRVKRKVIKPLKKVDKILTTEDKIKLSWEYIQSITSIPIKNDYIDRFIKIFSREPFENENQNYFYQRESESKLICKHYQYSSKIHNNSDAFISLKTSFGASAKDGIVSCICCGEYLCHEDASILEGFSEGAPKNTREQLDTDKNTLKALSDKQLDIKKKIQKISSLIGVELTEYDKQTIIDYFDNVDDEDLIDTRYKNPNTLKKHPGYKALKKQYKFVKPAKTKEDKENNKRNLQLLDKDIIRFKGYLTNGNELLIITFLILFNLQVSSPPYDLKGKMLINLWEKDILKQNQWSGLSRELHKKISMKTIDNIFNNLSKYANINKKDNFWKDVRSLLNEGELHKELLKPKAQFLQTAFYVLRDSKIRRRLKDYYNYENDIVSSLYLRENWSSYKPLKDNKIIEKLNKQINEQLKQPIIRDNLIKKGPDISYENISSIEEMRVIYENPKYKLLNIPYSDIINNESYKRLIEFSIHLHGKSKEISTLNLIINQFINTVENKKEIEKIMEDIGWDKKNKTLKSVDYSSLRDTLLVDIQKLAIKKNPEEKNIIKTFNYIKLHNWNGMLLNSYPKRNYGYVLPVIFPNKTYEELKDEYDILEKEDNEDKINIIKSLFKRFCIDDEGNINKKMSHDDFILNIVADPSFEREVNCSRDIKINKENFMKILDFNRKLYQLPLLEENNNIENVIEKRLQTFIDRNGLLNYQGDNSFELLQRLHNLYNLRGENNEIIKREYRTAFNLVDDYKNKAIENIKLFILKSQDEGMIDPTQLKYFKKNRGTLNQIDIYINYYLNNSKNIENNISNLIYIIGRLSNNRNEKKIGTILSDDIPKHWKLTETNENYIANFISEKEFLRHNDIFLDSKKYEGFYKYLEDKKYAMCFKGLLRHLQGYYKEGVYSLYGDNNKPYTELYYGMFIKFLFVFLFEKIIEYIEELYDEQSVSSQRANELFLLLEEQDALQLKDSIEHCTHLMFDLLNHFLDENSDPNWLFQVDDLSDKISRQKEIEKQNLINGLEGQTAEQRAVTVEMQAAGLSNWYKDQSKANLDRQATVEYQEQLENERMLKMKEILLEKQTELEVTEAFGINVENLLPGVIEEEDEGYSQRDEDREDEGLDDADEDGDYREN